MSIVKMSIHRALAEKKTYDDRIRIATNSLFVVANKASNAKIGGKTIEEVKSSIDGNHKSVMALIENKKRLVAAIVECNAKTKVEVAGKEYTIADAIERKKLIKLETDLLTQLKYQYMKAKNEVDTENAQLPKKLENYLQSVLGDKASRGAEEIEKHTNDFMRKNTFELIDPIKIEDKIKELEKDIMDFKMNVDYVLSESNATTFVDVEFVD